MLQLLCLLLLLFVKLRSTVAVRTESLNAALAAKAYLDADGTESYISCAARFGIHSCTLKRAVTRVRKSWRQNDGNRRDKRKTPTNPTDSEPSPKQRKLLRKAAVEAAKAVKAATEAAEATKAAAQSPNQSPSRTAAALAKAAAAVEAAREAAARASAAAPPLIARPEGKRQKAKKIVVVAQVEEPPAAPAAPAAAAAPASSPVDASDASPAGGDGSGGWVRYTAAGEAQPKEGWWRLLAQGEAVERGSEVTMNMSTGQSWVKYSGPGDPPGRGDPAGPPPLNFAVAGGLALLVAAAGAGAAAAALGSGHADMDGHEVLSAAPSGAPSETACPPPPPPFPGGRRRRAGPTSVGQ